MQKGKPLRAPFSFFVDRTVQPGLADFRTMLGRACRAWDDLEALLSRTFGLKARIHFMYGERYGWALRFERSGRLVAALYPNRGRLSVQVILNRAQVDTAMAMRLPPHVARALKTARDYPEGRWLFIPVKSRKSAGELRTILTLKIPLPARDGNRRADSGNG